METAAVSKEIVKCCQWSSQINRDHRGVVEELRRLQLLDEEREEYQRRFRIIDNEILVLLDELRTCTALSMDARKNSMITGFIDKVLWSWQDAECWIHHETNQLKTQCCHVYSSYCLHDFAEETKKSIRGTYRLVFEMSKNTTTWHPECIKNFNKMHNLIIPKLSSLLQCDNILRSLTYFKRATPFREQQQKELQSFIATHLQPTDSTIPNLLTTPDVENLFYPLCELLTGELLGLDPLDVDVPPPKPQQPSELTYQEPLTYQAFKNLPKPVPNAKQLSRGCIGRPLSDGVSYGEVVSYMRSWEMGTKGFKAPMKKRGPYKKKDKPLVVTCELVKVRDAAETLAPIKMPKLRGNLLMPLN